MNSKREIPVAELLQKAIPIAQPCIGYANVARVSIMGLELFVDFVLVSPSIGSDEPTATHIQRIILPIAQARPLINALSTVLSNWEEVNQPPSTP